MRKISCKTGLLAFSLLYFTFAVHAQKLTIIELQYRRADEVINIIRPLLKANEGVTGHAYEIYLNAGPDTLRNIRKIIAKLDKKPVQLLISVKSNNYTVSADSGFQLNGSISGKNVRVISGNANSNNNVALSASSRSSTTSARRTPQIRVLEGQPALINTGSSMPVKMIDRQYINGRLIEREITDYKPIQSGYYVTAWLNGNTVKLELDYQHNAIQKQGVIDVSSLSTTFHGKLGEWIPVSAISRTETGNQNQALNANTTRTNRQSDNTVYIKVEKLSEQ